MFPQIRQFLPCIRVIRGSALLALLLTLAAPFLGGVLIGLSASLTDQVFIHRHFHLLPGYLAGYAALAIARVIVGQTRSYLDSANLERLAQEVRCVVYGAILSRGEAVPARVGVGELVSTLSSDVERVGYLVYSGPIGLVAKAASFAVYATMMLSLSWRLTLCALVVGPVLALMSSRSSPVLQRLSRICRQRRAGLSGLLEERLNALRLVREFNTEDLELDLMARRARQVRRAELSIAAAQARIAILFQVTTILGGLAIMAVGSEEVSAGRLSVGALVAFVGSLGSLHGPITGVARSALRFARARVSAERLTRLAEISAPAQDRPAAPALVAARGSIEFRDVGFAYAGGEPVLSHVSFRIAPGETVALAGASGDGKSTMAALMSRRVDPTTGSILIDGQDLRDVSRASVARTVRLVDQEPMLLRGPIIENIRYARLGASRAEVEAAAEAAGLGPFIGPYGRGLATSVGRRGGKLSGGQRQRIALARALLSDSPILILDEATAAVDSETEALIQEAIFDRRGDRTLILISHRLSSIQCADRVLVLQEGRIVEQGSPDQLLARGGRFAGLFEDQVFALREVA